MLQNISKHWQIFNIDKNCNILQRLFKKKSKQASNSKVLHCHEYDQRDHWFTILTWFPALEYTLSTRLRRLGPSPFGTVNNLTSCKHRSWSPGKMFISQYIWQISFVLRRELQHSCTWPADAEAPWPLPHQLLCPFGSLGRRCPH